MLDADRVRGAALPEVRGGWTARDVVLYHLAIGAGARPTDPAELTLTDDPRLAVLPSFAATAALDALAGLDAVPGLALDRARVLHGAQEVELALPLPTSATVLHRGRIAEIHDKGGAALLLVDVETTGAGDRLLARNRYSVVARGAGGFGGDRGPAARTALPDRPADVEVDCPTLPQQALLYRLTGDANPLHVDPEAARRAGFDRPILHGLCTYGIACRAAVGAALGGDPRRARGLRARFTGVVHPGDRLTTEVWSEPDRVALRVRASGRAGSVLEGDLRTSA